MRAALLVTASLLTTSVHADDVAEGRRVALDPERGDCGICHLLPDGDARNQGTIGPPLRGLAERYTAASLKARIADPKQIDAGTMMPGYGVVEGLHRVSPEHAGKPVLTDAELDALVAYLLAEAR